jgi:hypothetical protein
VFIPAIIAEMNFFPIDLKLLKFFRRLADVTFKYVLGIHRDLHWLVGCYHHSEDFSRRQGTPSKIPFSESGSIPLRALHTNHATRNREEGLLKK